MLIAHLASVKPLLYLRQKDDCFIIDILWLGVAKDNILIFDTAALHNKYRHYACPSLTSRTKIHVAHPVSKEGNKERC